MTLFFTRLGITGQIPSVTVSRPIVMTNPVAIQIALQPLLSGQRAGGIFPSAMPVLRTMHDIFAVVTIISSLVIVQAMKVLYLMRAQLQS